jgi:hypothetical protein
MSERIDKQRGLRGKFQKAPKSSAMADALKSAGIEKMESGVTKKDSRPQKVVEVTPNGSSAEGQMNRPDKPASPGPNNRIRGKIDFQSTPARKGPPNQTKQRRKKAASRKQIAQQQAGNTAGQKIPVPDLSVYRSKSKPKRPSRTATTSLRVTGKVDINPAIRGPIETHINAPISFAEANGLGHSESDDELELVVGLDFGTTYCKVVIRERASGRAWAVPLSVSQQNPYLLCTRVWRQEGKFTLSPEGRAETNLKLQLIDDDASKSALVAATAFMTLLLRHIKAWYWKHLAKEYPGFAPLWLVHMGLPVSNLDESEIRRRFQQMLWSAMLLSNELAPQINLDAVQQSLECVNHAIQAGDQEVSLPSREPVHRDQLRLFPEVAAQIYGYFRSDQRDPSLHTFMLADVGGGTVDAGLFQVTKVGDDAEEVVFSAAVVEQLGVYVLHRNRLAWHRGQLEEDIRCADVVAKLRALEESGASPAAVPGLIEHYLKGVSYPEQTCDWQFANDFGTLLWRHVVMAARQATGEQFPAGPALPFLLCGGGRSLDLYKRFAQKINAPNSGTRLRLRVIELARPSDLEPRGIGKDQYHRLSVAYGLSFDDIGEVVTPKMLPPPPPPAPFYDLSDGYISKEYC